MLEGMMKGEQKYCKIWLGSDTAGLLRVGSLRYLEVGLEGNWDMRIRRVDLIGMRV